MLHWNWEEKVHWLFSTTQIVSAYPVFYFINFIKFFLLVDEAVNIAHLAVFANHGQNCCAGSRTFVQSGIYDAFVKKAAALAKSRKVGDPFISETEQGPQVDQPSVDKILRLVESGKKQGAKLEVGGSRIGNEGYFVQPTVFSNVTDNMEIAQEEVSVSCPIYFWFMNFYTTIYCCRYSVPFNVS